MFLGNGGDDDPVTPRPIVVNTPSTAVVVDEEEDEEEQCVARPDQLPSDEVLLSQLPSVDSFAVLQVGQDETNLQFEPVNLYLSRTEATPAHLEQIRNDISTSLSRIYQLQAGVVGLRQARTIHSRRLDDLLHKTSQKTITRKFCTRKKNQLTRLLTSMRVELFRSRQRYLNLIQRETAIRIGINFQSSEPSNDFVVQISTSEQIFLKSETTSSTNRPDTDRHPRQTNDVIGPYVIQNDLTKKEFPIMYVENLNRFLEKNIDSCSKLIVFPFESQTTEFLEAKNTFRMTYTTLSQTIKLYFNTNYYNKKVNEMSERFLALFQIIEKPENDPNRIAMKKLTMKRINNLIMEKMTKLLWYRYPDKSILEVVQMFENEMKQF